MDTDDLIYWEVVKKKIEILSDGPLRALNMDAQHKVFKYFTVISAIHQDTGNNQILGIY